MATSFIKLRLLIITEVRVMSIEIPTIGEILKEEFMDPMGLSAYRIAKDIGVPTSRIQEILKGKRRVSAETSIRLGRYFGVSEKYFINMQNDIDIRNLKKEKQTSFDKIVSLPKIAVL